MKKFLIAAVALALFATLTASPAVAGGPQGQTRNEYRINYQWVFQFMKFMQYRYVYAYGVDPADGPDDTTGGWGPGDGTGNDGDGPEDGTGYGPGAQNYCYQKYGERLCNSHGSGSPTYRFQQRGQ